MRRCLRSTNGTSTIKCSSLQEQGQLIVSAATRALNEHRLRTVPPLHQQDWARGRDEKHKWLLGRYTSSAVSPGTIGSPNPAGALEPPNDCPCFQGSNTVFHNLDKAMPPLPLVGGFLQHAGHGDLINERRTPCGVAPFPASASRTGSWNEHTDSKVKPHTLVKPLTAFLLFHSPAKPKLRFQTNIEWPEKICCRPSATQGGQKRALLIPSLGFRLHQRLITASIDARESRMLPSPDFACPHYLPDWVCATWSLFLEDREAVHGCCDPQASQRSSQRTYIPTCDRARLAAQLRNVFAHFAN